MARTAAGAAVALGAWAGTSAAQSASTTAASDVAARLRQVDALLSTAEAQLHERGARMAADGDAGRRGGGGTLVVLLRAEGPGHEPLGSAAIALDETQVGARTYSAAEREAFAAGGVDELYRGTVLPVPHALTLTVTAGGGSVSQSATVAPAPDGRPTYVEFAVRGGRLQVASWLGGAPAGPR